MMEIPEEHKEVLRKMGVAEAEFSLFDGKTLTYESDPEKGVRIYDPAQKTSIQMYVGIDGWTSWSSEDDDFMSRLFPDGPPQRANAVTRATGEEAVKEVKEKFKKKE